MPALGIAQGLDHRVHAVEHGLVDIAGPVVQGAVGAPWTGLARAVAARTLAARPVAVRPITIRFGAERCWHGGSPAVLAHALT
jgi:hypothetical protein